MFSLSDESTILDQLSHAYLHDQHFKKDVVLLDIIISPVLIFHIPQSVPAINVIDITYISNSININKNYWVL